MSEQSYVPLNVGEGYFSDWQPPISVDDGKTWVWNHAQQKYVPQALSAGVTDHALLTHLDFASSGHTGFEQAGAGAAAVAAHVGLADSHSQYLLASGIRNGAATIVASGINATPLTLKLASGQVADGLRVADASNSNLALFDYLGRMAIGIDSPVVDYGGGYGETYQILVDRTLTDINTGVYSDGSGHFGIAANLTLDDRSASDTNFNDYASGIYGNVTVAPTATYVPYSIAGLQFTVKNQSSGYVGFVQGASITALSYSSSDTDALYGASIAMTNYGSGNVSEGAGIYIYAPFANHPYAVLCGIDIQDLTGISSAATKYAIRTQGGQVLHQAGAAGVVPLVAQGAASQTADQIQSKNSAGTVEFAVGAGGKLKTNQAAANTHTPSGATAKQLPIYDAAGFLLGYIPIYGSAW